MIIDKLSLLMYTNESYLPIANLSIQEFNKFSKDIKIKKYLATNKITSDFNHTDNDFEILDNNIELSLESRQFAEVLIYALEKIPEKYVLFLLEDTFIANDIKGSNLNSIIELMDDNKINHLSLMSYSHPWEILNVDYSKYNLPNDLLFTIPNSYLYTFSLQPSIWETKTLLDILKHNIGITLHEFDTSRIKNKRGEIRNGDDGNGYINTPKDFWDYGIKHCCFNRTFETSSYCFDDRPFNGDYFLFLYSEVIRHGKFNVNTHNNCREFIVKYLEEKNINETHPLYKKYF